jgi:hypothetical protein
MVAALSIGVGSCWGKACGDMLEAMARVAPSQANEAMAGALCSSQKWYHFTRSKLLGQHSRKSKWIQKEY